MEPVTLLLLLGGGAAALWALTGVKGPGAPGSEETEKLAALVSSKGPRGERAFLSEPAKNLLLSLASSTVTTPDLSNPALVEYAPVPSGKALPTDQSAFGWVSRENKSKSILAPLYAVTTAAAKQRKFLRSVEPGTEADLAGPNGIYAVLLYAGALTLKETPPGSPVRGGATVPAPPSPPTGPSRPSPGGGPIPPVPSVPGVIQPVSFTPPTQPQPPGQVPLPPVPSDLGMGPAIVVTQTDPLNVRSAPTTTSSIVGKVPKGSTVMITGPMISGMAPITFGALKGFAYGGYLRAVAPGSPAAVLPPAPAAATPTAAIPVSVSPQTPVSTVIEPMGARVRSSPSSAVSTNILGALAKGSTVSITGPLQPATGETWAPITVLTVAPGSSGVKSGTTGFVASRLLSSGGGMLAGADFRLARLLRARRLPGVRTMTRW